MNQETLLFLTNGPVRITNTSEIYDYKDGMYVNVFTGQTFFRWSGQRKSISKDKLVMNRDTIHIWHRNCPSTQFKYHGMVIRKELRTPRDDDNILIVDLYVTKNNLTIDYGTVAEKYPYKNGDSTGIVYKMDCFAKLGLTPTKNDWCTGIMTGN